MCVLLCVCSLLQFCINFMESPLRSQFPFYLSQSCTQTSSNYHSRTDSLVCLFVVYHNPGTRIPRASLKKNIKAKMWNGTAFCDGVFKCDQSCDHLLLLLLLFVAFVVVVSFFFLGIPICCCLKLFYLFISLMF